MANYLQSPQGMNEVARCLSAKSRNGLSRAMLINNRRYRAFIKYFGFCYNQDIKEYECWYYSPQTYDDLKELLGGEQ